MAAFTEDHVGAISFVVVRSAKAGALGSDGKTVKAIIVGGRGETETSADAVVRTVALSTITLTESEQGKLEELLVVVEKLLKTSAGIA